MEGLVRLINYSLNNSIKGMLRWGEMFHPRGFLETSLVPLHNELRVGEEQGSSLNDVEDEDGKWSGFLWAAPKKRTTKMKRLRRKFGHSDYAHATKFLKPKTNLRICDTCGNHYEAFHLCGHCYERIKKETEMIRKQVDEKVGDGAEDKGIFVMYEKEKEKFEGVMEAGSNIIVEIKKPRPSFFSGNLLQRTTLRVNPEAKSVSVPTPVPIINDKNKT